MTIAYLSTFYPLRGGIAQFNASLLHALEQRGHDVRAFTFRRQYPDILFPGQSQYVAPGDPADPIDSTAVLDTINPLSYYRTASVIAQSRPGMLLMKFWMPFFAPSLGTVARLLRRRNVKAVSILDNVIPHEKRPGDDQLLRFFLRQNDGFVVMSETVKRDLLSIRPEAVYEQLPHPLYDHFGTGMPREEARRRLGIGPDEKILLFFGFIRGYKGLDILLKALPLLPPEYRIVIAGEVYGSFSEYEEIIRAHGLEDRIHRHVRYISDAEVPVLFCASDLCVLPYRSATQSGIIPIAYHFNLPVVITDVGSLTEMVEPYDTGLIAREVTPEAIAERILQFFTEPGRRDLCANNIAKYKEKHSWDSLAAGILRLYERLHSPSIS